MFRYVVKAARRVLAELEELAEELSEDPQLQTALESELGLPPGALDNVQPAAQEPLTAIDAYVASADPSAEQMKIAFDAMARYLSFWTTIFDAAKTEDPTIVVDEALYRLLQTTTVDLLKFDYPWFYAWMRLIGVIEQDLRLTLEEAFAPEVPANIFSGGYRRAWLEVAAGNYERFRTDQDIPPLPPDAAPAESVVRRQLGAELYALSDAAGLLMMVPEWALKKIDGTHVEHYYGWDLPPRPPQLLGEDPPKEVVLNPAEHIASRASTLRITDADGDGMLLTQLLLRDAQNRLGWLLSLRGVLELERSFGSERPVRVKLQAVAQEGLDVILPLRGGGGIKLPGALGGALHFEVAPETSSHTAPALTIPQATGSRFEIGEFSVKGSISKDGLHFRAEVRKGALVIVGAEGDGLTGEALPAGETRVEFEFAILLDEHGLRVEGGGRLGAVFAVNRSSGPIHVQQVAVQLHPRSVPTGSEFRFEVAAGMDFDLGPVKVSLDGIGATLGLGVGTEVPPGASGLLGAMLHLTKLGYHAPKGVGLAVESSMVNGGGYLFRDEDTGEYAGVLQLTIGKRLTLTAVGLIGTKPFSLLLIASLEFSPAIPLFAGIGLRGVGLLGGVHRTVNPDVLRAGLRNKTLDAVLFPKDAVANAPQIVSSLKSVFPPARGRHLFGLMVSLSFLRGVITAELGVIYEFGAKRWIMLGQIKALYPAKPPSGVQERLLEMNVDAVGVWDPELEEFSLDATLYDSKIAFVSFSGDVAVRVRKGHTFLFSAGGYHPEFAVPPGFPQLQRVKISLADSKSLKLLLTGYVAITSNTRQIGARMEFFAEFAGFSIEAVLGFDALWEPDVRFLIDFDLEFKLKYKGVTFFGVDVSGRFSGPQPKRVAGEWSIDLWLTSISKKFDKTFGADRPPVALPPVDPLPPLVAALKDPLSWTAEPPGVSLVSFRAREAQFVHPMGRLAVRQQVLPLGIRLDRFGGAPLASPQRFDITSATVGVRQVTSPPPRFEVFAAAEYLELSDDQKLSRPSFESMTAGAELSPAGVTFGPAVDAPLRYEDKIFGAAGGPPVTSDPRPVSGQQVLVAAEFSAPARSRLRERFVADGPDLQVGPPRYVLASVDDLAVAGPATSYTAAQQAVQPGMQVVFGTEVAS